MVQSKTKKKKEKKSIEDFFFHIFMSGAATSENITDGVHEMK